MSFATTSLSQIQAVMYVMNYGVSAVAATNRMLISNNTDGNNWFVSLRNSGTVWLSNVGTGGVPQLYVDGSQVDGGGAMLRDGFYANKWSVIIMNGLTLPSGNLNFLGYTAGTASWTPPLGARLGCIALFNQTLSPAEMGLMTAWGLQRFAMS